MATANSLPTVLVKTASKEESLGFRIRVEGCRF